MTTRGADGPPGLAEWYELLSRPSVVKRGLKVATVVGTILIAINHGDAIVRGELNATDYLKMGLTVMVPYMVSVFSSVSAIIDQRAERAASRERSPAAGG